MKTPTINATGLHYEEPARPVGALTARIRAQQAGPPLTAAEMIKALNDGTAIVMHCPNLDDEDAPKPLGPNDAYQSHCPWCHARPGEHCHSPRGVTLGGALGRYHPEREDKERRRQETARQNHDRNHDKNEASR